MLLVPPFLFSFNYSHGTRNKQLMTGSVLGQYRLKPAAVEDLRFNSANISAFADGLADTLLVASYYVET